MVVTFPIVFFCAVLNDVSAEDVAGRQIREAAKSTCVEAQKLIKDMEYEEKKGGKSSSINRNTQDTQDYECELSMCHTAHDYMNVRNMPSSS